MERWDIKLERSESRHGRHRRENPSFSSTLLDAIYRSIDEGGNNGGDQRERPELLLYKDTMRKKQSTTKQSTTKQSTTTATATGFKAEEDETMTFRRACLIEKWMEKKAAAVSSEKTNTVQSVRRNSMADLDRKKLQSQHYIHQNQENYAYGLLNSSSSSSESSCGGGFSSSESEYSAYASRSRSTSSSCYSMQRPKPIRTSSVPAARPEKPKPENGFGKTKSKALKIYGDLKKVKQPISPGGKLASFLNSLFNAGHAKKAKIHEKLGSERKSMSSSKLSSSSSSSSTKMGYSSTTTSACSSASSFSRSCLRKTPLSMSNGGGAAADVAKRSVRFYPVSVIVGEDCRPCGQKTLEPGLMAVAAAIKNPANEDELRGCYVMDEDEDENDRRRRVEQVARDYLLNNYRKTNGNKNNNHDEDEEDDDDAASYASSDLFELDTVGVEERYREELPVYETTYFDRNRAIANGLIL